MENDFSNMLVGVLLGMVVAILFTLALSVTDEATMCYALEGRGYTVAYVTDRDECMLETEGGSLTPFYLTTEEN